jgi:uroporphyrinogen-III synthase
LRPADGALLHVAGSVVAGDLAGRLGEAGFAVHRAVLYEAKPAERLTAGVRERLAAKRFDAVLFFSPRTATTFAELARVEDSGPRADAVVDGCRRAVALCLGPSVAKAAGALPWREVRGAGRPDLTGMMELIESELAESARPVEAPPQAQAAPAKRGGFKAALAVALIVLAAVVAAIAASQLDWFASPPPAADPALQVAVNDLRAEVGSLGERVAALESAPRDSPAREEIAALGGRIDEAATEVESLRQQVRELYTAPPPTVPDDVMARLNALERRTAPPVPESLDSAPPTPALDPALVERLERDNQMLRTEMAALQGDITVLQSTVTGLRAQSPAKAALVLAVGQLRAALAGNRPFAGEFDALRALARSDAALAPIVERLAPWAGRGVRTLPDLQASFPGAIGVAASESAPPTGPWYQRLWLRLSGLVSVRRVGSEVPGEDIPARIARAEALLGEGDLAGAVMEFDSRGRLPPALAEWLEEARGRLIADAAGSELAAAAAAALGPGG